MDVTDGRYTKRSSPAARIPLPENNWVWSPQGAINMHMPERWGFCAVLRRLPGAGTDAFVEDPNERVKWALRRLYYRQRALRARTGAYAATLDALNVSDVRVEGLDFRPVMHATPSLYEIVAPGFAGASSTSPGRAGVGDAVKWFLAARFSQLAAELGRRTRISARAPSPEPRAASREPRVSETG